MHYALLNTERKSKSCTINADAEIMSEALNAHLEQLGLLLDMCADPCLCLGLVSLSPIFIILTCLQINRKK
jgi:hypothetical protein